MTSYAERLRLSYRLTARAIEQCVASLELPPGSHGLDAGCGIGEQALLLATAAGPWGSVTALDNSPDQLAAAAANLAGRPGSERIRLLEGNIERLPFPHGHFDWVWCCDTLWPVAVTEDPCGVTAELARVVRPGGTLALAYWSGQCLLPGHPALESHLSRVFAEHTPYMSAPAPAMHHMRALHWLDSAGLKRLRARTFVAEWQAPLTTPLREALTFCFSMLWDSLQPSLSQDASALYQAVARPGGERFVLDSPHYYGYITYTVFSGTKVAGKGCTASSLGKERAMKDEPTDHEDPNEEPAYCQQCGDPVTGSDQFCAGCGAPAGEKNEQPKEE